VLLFSSLLFFFKSLPKWEKPTKNNPSVPPRHDAVLILHRDIRPTGTIGRMSFFWKVLSDLCRIVDLLVDAGHKRQ
jgi:hypothetical protein